MTTKYSIVVQSPGALAEPEIQDFIAMVRAGEEVGGAVLEANVRKAEYLAVARQASCLVAVAALKNPKASYRKKIQLKAGVAIDRRAFPFEFGYLFVLPSARGQGIGVRMSEAILSAAGGKGVFATARTNNDVMHVILAGMGFSKMGKPYPSDRGRYQLQLFLCPDAQFPVAADASQVIRC